MAIRPTPRRSVLTLAFLLAGAAAVVVLRAQNPPVFRTETELIRVDVQVVTGKGLPVLGLGPDKFEVTVNGRPRRVVSADLVMYDSARVTAEQPVAPGPRVVGRLGGPPLPRRLFMLTVDERSFLPGYAAGALEAARGFVGKLQPTDLLGFVSYPSGAVVNPTTDRAPVLEAMKKTVGLRQLPVGQFDLRVSDIVTLSRKIELLITESEQGSNLPIRHPELAPILEAVCPPTGGRYVQGNCYRVLAEEVQNFFLHFESEASMSFGVIRGIMGDLSKIDGRKYLVLLSGGLVVADQTGGRPDVGNLAILMAQEAARANVGIYTIFTDWKFLEQFSASKGRLPAVLDNLARDTSINSHWLDTFSTTAGGEMFTVSAGNGDFAFNRILSESSAYYLLGVVPENVDRDGRPRRLSVKVKQRGVTIRSREWVVVRDRTPTEVAAYVPPDVPENEEAVVPETPPAAPAPPVAAIAPPPVADPALARAPAARAAPAPREPLVTRPPVPAIADSPALPFVLTNAGTYVTHFDRVFANVVAEERYVQTTEIGGSSRPTVPRRVSTSDFLLVTLPGGNREWYRDTFDVNGSAIRDRQQRLVAIFNRPDSTSIARANAILKESATYNIGVDRTINLPTLGLVPLQPRMQRRFSFSGGSIDRSLGPPAYVVAFTEVVHPSVIKGTNDGDLLMQGRLWVDVKTGYVLKTELALDDAGVSATISMLYRPDPAFGVAVPVEMLEDYTEADGRRTMATATYSRFRRFGVETRDEMVPGR